MGPFFHVLVPQQMNAFWICWIFLKGMIATSPKLSKKYYTMRSHKWSYIIISMFQSQLKKMKGSIVCLIGEVILKVLLDEEELINYYN